MKIVRNFTDYSDRVELTIALTSDDALELERYQWGSPQGPRPLSETLAALSWLANKLERQRDAARPS